MCVMVYTRLTSVSISCAACIMRYRRRVVYCRRDCFFFPTPSRITLQMVCLTILLPLSSPPTLAASHCRAPAPHASHAGGPASDPTWLAKQVCDGTHSSWSPHTWLQTPRRPCPARDPPLPSPTFCCRWPKAGGVVPPCWSVRCIPAARCPNAGQRQARASRHRRRRPWQLGHRSGRGRGGGAGGAAEAQGGRGMLRWSSWAGSRRAGGTGGQEGGAGLPVTLPPGW